MTDIEGPAPAADEPVPNAPDVVERIDEAQARAEVEAVIRSVSSGAGGAVEISSLPRANDYLDQLDREQDIGLKRQYATHLRRLLWAQLAVADGVFIAYAQVGVHWKLSANVINVWLGATFVEVVGIVLVVTRYLFPRRDGS